MVSAEFRRKREAKRKRKGKKAEPKVTSIEDAGAAALRAMRLHLELGEVEAALAVYNKSSRSLPAWQPAESDWRRPDPGAPRPERLGRCRLGDARLRSALGRAVASRAA